MLGKVAQQTKAQNYPEAYGVYVADIWKERLRSYLGRSHGRAETKSMKHGWNKICHEKSAEVIVCARQRAYQVGQSPTEFQIREFLSNTWG